MTLDDDAYNKIVTEILKICKDGCTQNKIIKQTKLSHAQLRGLTAEIVDRDFLRYIEPEHVYITTHKGYMFLQNVIWR
jgi:predicted transcriptional regulator